MLVQAGAHAKEEVCRTLVVHISNAPNLHAYAGRQAFKALKENQGQVSLLLLTTTAWLLGRYLYLFGSLSLSVYSLQAELLGNVGQDVIVKLSAKLSNLA